MQPRILNNLIIIFWGHFSECHHYRHHLAEQCVWRVMGHLFFGYFEFESISFRSRGSDKMPSDRSKMNFINTFWRSPFTGAWSSQCSETSWRLCWGSPEFSSQFSYDLVAYFFNDHSNLEATWDSDVIFAFVRRWDLDIWVNSTQLLRWFWTTASGRVEDQNRFIIKLGSGSLTTVWNLLKFSSELIFQPRI